MSSQSVSIGKPRQIFAQGDLDGSCFLYCIINSFVAVSSGPGENRENWISEKWTAPLGSMPFKLDDFLSGLGTEKIDDDLNCLEGVCRAFLRHIPRTNIQVSRKENISSKSLRESLTKNQVVIVATPKKGSHWICLVDADNDYFYAACSAQALNPDSKTQKNGYHERRSPNQQRLYNKVLKESELRIWKDYAIVITNAKAKGQA
jgi:hypothetical protein